MSDSDTTTSSTSTPVVDPPTEEIFVPDAGGHGGTPAAPGGSGAPWDGNSGDDDDAWPDRGPKKGVRMSIPTIVLFVLLIGAGGIWGGAALQRGEGSSSASSTRSSLASLFGGRGTTGAGSFFGTGGAAALGGATRGTVTEVTGSTLYVTNATGALVKVTVGPTATVDRDAKSNLAGLQVGDTVVVEGTTASNGSVTATSVTATGAGVVSPASRFTGAGAGG